MKILILINKIPYPQNSGNNIRNYQMINTLASEHEVRLVCACNKSKCLDELKKDLDIEVDFIKIKHNKMFSIYKFLSGASYNLSYNYCRRAKIKFTQIIDEYKPDIIQFNDLYLSQYINLNGPYKKVYNCDKVMYMLMKKLENRAKRSFLYKKFFDVEIDKIFYYESTVIQKCNLTIFSNPKDQSNINSRLQLLKDSLYLPVFIEKSELLPLTDKKNILFIGNFNETASHYLYNYYINNVHKALAEKHPDYKLLVCGHNLENIKYKDDNIKFISNDDMLEVYKNTRMLVLPHTVSHGISVKGVNAMAYGIPVVGTEVAFDWLDVPHKEKYVFIAENIEKLSKKIHSVIDNNDKLNAVRKEALRLVQKKYSFADFKSKLLDAYNNI